MAELKAGPVAGLASELLAEQGVGLLGPLQVPPSLEPCTQDCARSLAEVVHKQISFLLYRQECTEVLVVGWHSRQDKAELVKQLAFVLGMAEPCPLLVYCLDSSGLALEHCFQAGSGLR